jgi:hypothetical protein
MTRELAPVVPGPWRRKCTAKSKSTGERCRRWAIRGGDVCPMHGGSAKHVRQRAEQRMEDRLRAFGRRSMDAAEAALDSIEEIAYDPDAPARDRIAAFRAATSGVTLAKDATAESETMHPEVVDLTQEILRLVGADEAAVAAVGLPDHRRTRDVEAEIMAGVVEVDLADLFAELQRVGKSAGEFVEDLRAMPTDPLVQVELDTEAETADLDIVDDAEAYDAALDRMDAALAKGRREVAIQVAVQRGVSSGVIETPAAEDISGIVSGIVQLVETLDAHGVTVSDVIDALAGDESDA